MKTPEELAEDWSSKTSTRLPKDSTVTLYRKAFANATDKQILDLIKCYDDAFKEAFVDGYKAGQKAKEEEMDASSAEVAMLAAESNEK